MSTKKKYTLAEAAAKLKPIDLQVAQGNPAAFDQPVTREEFDRLKVREAQWFDAIARLESQVASLGTYAVGKPSVSEVHELVRAILSRLDKLEAKMDDYKNLDRVPVPLALDEAFDRLQSIERSVAYLKKAKVNRTDGTHVYGTTLDGRNLGEDFIPEGQMPKPQAPLHTKDNCPEGCKDFLHIGNTPFKRIRYEQPTPAPAPSEPQKFDYASRLIVPMTESDKHWAKSGHPFTDNGEGQCARCLSNSAQPKTLGQKFVDAMKSGADFSKAIGTPRPTITPEQIQQMCADARFSSTETKVYVADYYNRLASRINDFFKAK